MRKILLSLGLLLALTNQTFAVDNYAATAGSGLTFAAKDATGVLYSRFIGCDNTTVSQCWSIDASGRQLTTLTSGSVASGAFASGSIASGAFASGAVGSGAVASGAVASGAVASGAFAAGSLAAGAGVDGWDLTQGAKADSVCGTDTGTCSMAALLKRIAQQVTAGQITVGTAGSPSTQVLSVQGISGGTSVPIRNGASTYNTVAASQTAQALTGGGGGATGDYLSHCVLQPTTTGAGTMTILDNATTVFTFTTGTLSNLAPISIPIGAVSVSGAWKVTTGANETVTCVGKFT